MRLFKYVYYRFYTLILMWHTKDYAKIITPQIFAFFLWALFVDTLRVLKLFFPRSGLINGLIEHPYKTEIAIATIISLIIILSIFCKLDKYHERWNHEDPDQRTGNGMLIIMFVALVGILLIILT